MALSFLQLQPRAFYGAGMPRSSLELPGPRQVGVAAIRLR
jgi:hypothetical protein